MTTVSLTEEFTSTEGEVQGLKKKLKHATSARLAKLLLQVDINLTCLKLEATFKLG